MTDVIRGVIRGKIIELDEASGLPDGQAVSTRVQPLTTTGVGVKGSAGAWSDAGEEVDAWLAEMRASRHRGRGEPSG